MRGVILRTAASRTAGKPLSCAIERGVDEMVGGMKAWVRGERIGVIEGGGVLVEGRSSLEGEIEGLARKEPEGAVAGGPDVEAAGSKPNG